MPTNQLAHSFPGQQSSRAGVINGLCLAPDHILELNGQRHDLRDSGSINGVQITSVAADIRADWGSVRAILKIAATRQVGDWGEKHS